MDSSQKRSWARRALDQSLNVRSHERRPVALLWTHSFFLGVGVAYLISAALPIFLASFPIDYLPCAFAAAAVLELLIGSVSDRIEHSIGQIRMLRLVLLLLVAGTVAFLILEEKPGSLPPLAIAFGLLVWSRIMIFVSQNEFWGLPLHLFDVRQGKRLFSLIDSGSFLAKILGYFSVPLLTTFLKVPELLILSAVGTAISVYVLQRIISNYSHLMVHHGDEKQKHATSSLENSKHPSNTFGFLWRDKYLASLALVAFLALFSTTCIDYGFLRGIEQRKESLTEIANFIGLFLGVAKLISLVLKVGVVGRLFGKFGLARTIIVLPIGLFLTTVTGLAFSASSASGVMIWTFVAGMLLVELWSEAVQIPALAVAVQPLTKHIQHRGHQAIGNIIEPIALGAAGLLLYVLSVSVGFSLRGISVVMLGVFAAWAVTLVWFGKEYKGTVLRALKHRRIKSAELVWDNAARMIIAAKLRSTHAVEAEYALHLIPATEPAFLVDALPTLLHHSERSVRMAALRRFDDFQFPTAESKRAEIILGALLTSTSGDSDGNLLGQTLRAYTAVCPDVEAEEMKHWLDDERLPVREGLLAGLIKHKGIDGVLIAGEFVQSMAKSGNPTERASAAEIVGRVGIQQFYHSLLTLLSDDDPEVRLGAIRASALVAHPRLIEPVLNIYLQPASSRQVLILVESALRAFGNPVLPYLMQRIENGQVDSVRLQRIVRLLGHWSTDDHDAHTEFSAQAITLLLDLLEWPGAHPRVLSTLRLSALRALTGNAICVNDSERMNRLINEELRRAGTLVSMLHSVESPDIRSRTSSIAFLLRSTLSHEIAQATERVLMLLELEYDPTTIRRVRDSLLIGERLHHANAFEVLDHILTPDLSKEVVALIEASLFLNQRKQVGTLADIIPIDSLNLPKDSTLETLLRNEDGFYEPWTINVANFYFQFKESTPMPHLFERVILLKTVDLFYETPDAVLSHIAQALEEVHAKPWERIITKGETGSCLYIIVEGRVSVHDGEHTLAELHARDVVGEMSLLDPEPRSASVTALEETTLLKLDREVFYDLMIDNIEIARGAIATLCRRIRKQNEKANKDK